MAKTLLFALILSLSIVLPANGQEPGDLIPDNLEFQNLQNGKTINVSSLRGKVIIIDCWATWCAPCITAMEDLDKWQKQFKDKLVVFAVSEEKPERLNQYIKNRPNSLIIVSDTAGDLRKIFPYRGIPHTILIGTDGRVKAITGGENLSENVITRVLKNESINLPLKKDNMEFDLEDYLRTVFKSDTTLTRNFIIQPAIEGEATMSKTYPNTSFEDRRITIINAPIQLLVQLAWKSNYFRVANEYNGNLPFKEQEKFCIDVWVPEKSEASLLEYFRNELSKKFIDMEIAVEKRQTKTTVLYSDSSSSSKLQTCNEPFKNMGIINSLSFRVNCAGIKQLIDYLEGWGKCGTAVVDETGLTGQYRLAFELEPGKDSSLEDALKKLGLLLKKEDREIEIIVIRKKQHQ